MNKKYINLVVVLMVLFLSIGLVFITREKEKRPKFNDEELQFINKNRDKVFMTGYFPAERRFSKKLCEKIEEDTSLKLRIYDDSWNNTLKLLESGDLPIVMNMNKTKKRSQYANFTESLRPIPCGIYSNLDYGVSSFEDIMGKSIGVEKDVALLDMFTELYPKLNYELVVYDDFKDTRQAFKDGEIDCFLSTKSYNHNVKGLQFFPIESITMGTNHIGVSKNYSILYSIIDKEVTYLKESNYDDKIIDIISFELEKSMVEFNDKELDYLNGKDNLVIGLPSEYFLYFEKKEEEYSGIVPDIADKIGFICDKPIEYRYDTLSNLRLREDIDFYIDTITTTYNSNSIFKDYIIVVGTSNNRKVKEVYELAPYRVGVFGVPNYGDRLRNKMPSIKVRNYKDSKAATDAIENDDIDYLIMPSIYYASLHPSKLIEIRGQLEWGYNFFISNNEEVIEILNKCLSIINTQKIVHEDSTVEKTQNKQYLFLIASVAIALIYFIGRKLYWKYLILYYIDNEYDLYSLKYLEKKITMEFAYLVLIDIDNASYVHFYYGKVIYKKYIRSIIERINSSLVDNEHLIFVDDNRFIVVKEYNQDIMKFCHSLKKDVFIRDIYLNTDLSMAYIDYNSLETLKTSIHKLNMAMGIARDKKKIIYFGEQLQKYYMDRIEKFESIKGMINNGKIDIVYKEIIDKNGSLVGKYAISNVEDISTSVLNKYLEQMNLMSRYDKIMLNTILDSEHMYPVYINVGDKTVFADGFFDWLNSMLMESNTTIYLIVSYSFIEGNIDRMAQGKKIKFVLRDFGDNLKEHSLLRFNDIEYLFISPSLTFEPYLYKDILDYMIGFASKNNKKLISNNISFNDADFFIKGDE